MCQTLQMRIIVTSDEVGSNELQSEFDAISQPVEGSFTLIFDFFFLPHWLVALFLLHKTENNAEILM